MTAAHGQETISTGRQAIAVELAPLVDADVYAYAVPADIGDRIDRPRVELDLTGTSDAPDLWELTILVAVGAEADPPAAAATLDRLLQQIDTALPATVTAPEWRVEYSEDHQQWRAAGRVAVFRKG